jgi:hypothetical protein
MTSSSKAYLGLDRFVCIMRWSWKSCYLMDVGFCLPAQDGIDTSSFCVQSCYLVRFSCCFFLCTRRLKCALQRSFFVVKSFCLLAAVDYANREKFLHQKHNLIAFRVIRQQYSCVGIRIILKKRSNSRCRVVICDRAGFWLLLNHVPPFLCVVKLLSVSADIVFEVPLKVILKRKTLELTAVAMFLSLLTNC